MAILPNQHEEAYRSSRAALDRLGGQLRRIRVQARRANAAMVLLECGAMILGAVFLTVALTPVFYYDHRIFYVFSWSFVALMAAYWALRGFRRLRDRDTDDRAALRAEKARPDINNRLINAVQLGRELKEPGPRSIVSPELTTLAIQDADEYMKSARIKGIVDPLPVQKSAKPFFCLLLLVLVMFTAFYQDATDALRIALTDPMSFQDVVGGFRFAGADVPPRIGDFEVRYSFPKYTRRPPETDPNQTGDVFALRGTEVTVRARTNKRLSRAELVIDETERVPFRIRGRFIEARFKLMKDGTYRIEAEDYGGRANEDDYQRSVMAEIDRSPEVVLVAPAEGMEIAAGAKLQLTWRASDDYGIARAELVYQVLDKPERKRIASFKRPPLETESKYVWDLASCGFKAGDVVSFYVEAFDNDDVSGPNSGASDILYLQITDESDLHFELTDRKEALMEEALLALADDLEFTAGEGGASVPVKAVADLSGKMRPRRAALLDSLERLIEGMSQDALGSETDLESVERILSELKGIFTRRDAFDARFASAAGGDLKEGDARTFGVMHQGEIEALEATVLYFDGAVKKERLEEALMEKDRIEDLKDELMSLLSKLQSGDLDDEQLREIKDKLAKLQERLNETLANVMKSMMTVAEGFTNPDAQQKLQEVFSLSDIDRIMQELSAGGLERVLDMAQKMFDSLDQLMGQLQDMADETAPNMPFMEEFMAAGQGLYDEMKELSEDQRELLEETLQFEESLAEEERKKDPEADARLLSELDHLMAGMGDDLDQIRGQTQNFPGEKGMDLAGKTADMEKGLDRLRSAVEKNPFEALEGARKLKGDMEAFRKDAEAARSKKAPSNEDFKAMMERTRRFDEKNEELMKALDRRTDRLMENLGEGGKSRKEELAKRQGDLGERAGQLGRKGKQRFSPSGSPNGLPKGLKQSLDGAMEGLEKAGKSMRSAKGELKGTRPGQAPPHQRSALNSLGQGMNQMRNAMKGGMPMPGPGMIPGPGSAGGRGNLVGRGDKKTEKIVIPEAKDFKGPEKYRNDILEALKERYPERYEKHIKDYYKSIAK